MEVYIYICYSEFLDLNCDSVNIIVIDTGVYQVDVILLLRIQVTQPYVW